MVSVGLCLLVPTVFVGCGKNESAKTSGKNYPGAAVITLSGSAASIDGTSIPEYDYTWHCDPGTVHDAVEDAPAEYFTGTKPDTSTVAYIDHELYYYPTLPESGFKKVQYDGEAEWAYYYTDGQNDAFIFATLPALGQSIPTGMMHTEEEAAANKVLHITQKGTYVLRGEWKGQIKIDLGEDAATDAEQKVTLILDGADVECTVAPGIVFENVYECGSTEETDTPNADTTEAGATVILADGSENSITGQNVFRMLKTKYKDENSTDPIKVQKKMRKTDGALYAYMSMNIDGESEGTGKLTVTSSFEGIDSELHLSVRGGEIVVNSQDDGMNVNEDHISVISFLGGDVTIHAALGEEGDGVDSNGFIVVNGGTIHVDGIRRPDNALDSEDGIYYTAGEIYVDGEEQKLEAGAVLREIGNSPMEGRNPGDEFQNPDVSENFDLQEFKEKVAALDDDATLDDVLALLGRGRKDGTPPAPENRETPPEMPEDNR